MEGRRRAVRKRVAKRLGSAERKGGNGGAGAQGHGAKVGPVSPDHLVTSAKKLERGTPTPWPRPQRPQPSALATGDYKMIGTEPPSTDQAAPTTFEAGSEHRNTIAAAISSSRPKRPSGIFVRAASSASSREVPFAAAI
jgi:hypothetical protein